MGIVQLAMSSLDVCVGRIGSCLFRVRKPGFHTAPGYSFNKILTMSLIVVFITFRVDYMNAHTST
jgi:hypothetical protein